MELMDEMSMIKRDHVLTSKKEIPQPYKHLLQEKEHAKEKDY